METSITASFEDAPKATYVLGDRDLHQEWLEVGFLGHASFDLLHPADLEKGELEEWQCTGVPTFDECWTRVFRLSGSQDFLQELTSAINGAITSLPCGTPDHPHPGFHVSGTDNPDIFVIGVTSCPHCQDSIPEATKREALHAIGEFRLEANR